MKKYSLLVPIISSIGLGFVPYFTMTLIYLLPHDILLEYRDYINRIGPLIIYATAWVPFKLGWITRIWFSPFSFVFMEGAEALPSDFWSIKNYEIWVNMLISFVLWLVIILPIYFAILSIPNKRRRNRAI
jgi:hypothetical protein